MVPFYRDVLILQHPELKGVRPAIHLSRNMWKWVQNAKTEKCIVRYFVRLFSLFAFRSILCQSWHSCKNSEDFVVYFFAVLIKHKIRLKCEKCIVSVSHFAVCFAKTLAKYLRNAKYEKCIAGHRKEQPQFSQTEFEKNQIQIVPTPNSISKEGRYAKFIV